MTVRDEASLRDRALRWTGPVAVTALGGYLRLKDLAQPHAFVFDETYYAKDGYALLQFGSEVGSKTKANERILEGQTDIFTGDPSFIVHPPVGKWLIAAGESVFGLTPFGWRIVLALMGTFAVLVLARTVQRMTGSAIWGTVAGLLLAVDGMAIVMSRTAVLDGMLMFFVLASFSFLVIDRDRSRNGGHGGHWWRPWRLAAAVALGLACGVKWSGIYYVVAFGLLTVLWDVAWRHRQGQRPFRALLTDALPAALTIVPIVLAVYLASWYGWYFSDNAWDRNWNPGSGPIAAMSSLFHYHAEMWNFHNKLTSDHSYESSAFGWLVQARPTSFFFESPAATGNDCPSGKCAAAVTALGNPIIWWAATLSLLHQLWRWIAVRDWRAGAVLAGVAAGWLPWIVFPDRTIFSFYSIVFTPFLLMGLTLTLASIAAPASRPNIDRNGRIVLVGAFLLVCIAVSYFFYPVWTAQVIDHNQWSNRMWLPTWV